MKSLCPLARKFRGALVPYRRNLYLLFIHIFSQTKPQCVNSRPLSPSPRPRLGLEQVLHLLLVRLFKLLRLAEGQVLLLLLLRLLCCIGLHLLLELVGERGGGGSVCVCLY